MNMQPPDENQAQSTPGDGQDQGAPKSKVQAIIDRIESDLTELKAAAAEEETPQGEAEEHGGNPEDFAAAMQGGESPAQPAEGEAGAEALPFKKKKPGFLAKGLGLQ